MTHPAKTYQERGRQPGSLSLWDFRSAAQPTHSMRMGAENPGNIHEATSAKFPARRRGWLMLGFSGLEISFYYLRCGFEFGFFFFNCGHKHDAKAWTSKKYLLSCSNLMPESYENLKLKQIPNY